MNYEITSPNPTAFDDYKVLFFYDNRDYHDRFFPILEMCGLRHVDKFEVVADAVNELISVDYDMVILTYLDKAEESARLVNECRSLSITLPFVAITEKGIGLKSVLGIYSNGVDEIVWPPLSANKLGKLLQSLVNASQNDKYKEAHAVARQLLESGDFDNAEVAYKKLLNKNAYRIDASLALSVINLKREKQNEAKHLLLNAQAYAKAIPNLVKKAYHLSRVIYYLGEFYRDTGLLENAIRHYQAALSMNPHLHQAALKLATVFRDQGDVDALMKLAQETRKTFNNYSEQISDISEFVFDQAVHFDDLGMQAKAQELFYYLLSYPHANPTVHIKVADYFWAQSQFSAVITRFEKLETANIKIPEALAKHGECLLDIQKNHMQTPDVEVVEEADNQRFMGMRGSTLIDNATELLQEALLQKQDLLCAWICLVRCYLRKDNIETAADVLNRFVAKIDDNAEIIISIISALFDEEAHDLAYKKTQEALEKYPSEGRLYLFSAQYLRINKKYYDAVGTLKQGLQIDENNTDMMIQIGEAYMDLDNASDAVLYLERASRLLPTDENIQQKLNEALVAKSKTTGKKKRPLPIG